MKLSLAVSLLLASSTAAFAPQPFGARGSALHSTTVADTPTYTFAKSEEIFAEAQTVR